MLERSFRAKRFDDAIAQIKSELGADAVILSSRQITPSGRRGDLCVEVRAIAAEDAGRMGYRSGGSSPLERRLTTMGVPPSAVRALAGRVIREMGGEPANMLAAKDALTTALEEELVFAGPLGQESRAVALVGPTGVGKTTTVAKIAARASLLDLRRVSLITLDQYRIGATEQIEHYAELIGVPLEVAHDRRSLEVALRRQADADLVLIDSAGRSPRDIAAVGELSETLLGVDESVEVALCVPAAIRDSELTQVANVLAPLRPSRLLCTKLDEAVFLGSIIAAQVQTDLPLSYFTTGQRVPEDIEVAGAPRLAALMCGEEVE
ncbi:MAG: hypothetical protein AAGF12_05935 [Myxococcota bacterium]